MAKRFQMPFAQWTNTNSAIEAGAKLEFFESGTSTPLDTYTDETQATPNANPVIADAAGQFPAIFLQARDYKTTLKDSSDVQLWSADPVIGGLEGTGAVVPRGHLAGLGISNAADTEHDIQTVAGIARSAADTSSIQLASAIIKQIDVDWAEGTNDGGFPSSLTLAVNTWYHCFVIFNPATNTVDAGFDSAITAVALLLDATGYTEYRRIGAVLTDGSSNIVQFVQHGDYFWWDVTTNDFNAVPVTTAASVQVRVPPGIQMIARLRTNWETTAAVASSGWILIYPTSVSDETPTTTNATLSRAIQGDVNDDYNTVNEIEVLTNIGREIRHVGTVASGTLTIRTIGWIDSRGKDD